MREAHITLERRGETHQARARAWRRFVVGMRNSSASLKFGMSAPLGWAAAHPAIIGNWLCGNFDSRELREPRSSAAFFRRGRQAA
jgi:hypothetical protein